MPSQYNRSKKKKGGKKKKGKGGGGQRQQQQSKSKQTTESAAPGAALVDRLGGKTKVATSQQNLRLTGPRDEDRRFPKWTGDQIQRFLQQGEWEDDDDRDAQDLDTDTNVEQGDENELDLLLSNSAHEMPLPRPIDSVFGAQGGSSAPEAAQTGLLGTLLNPDAGGKGRNTDGIMGLVASQAPKPKINTRAQLRAKLRNMQKSRGKMTDEDVVRDARGRKVRGARQMTQEDMMYGNGAQRARNAAVDSKQSTALRAQKIAELQAAIEKRQEERAALSPDGESSAADNQHSDEESSSDSSSEEAENAMQN